jgi:hypothetical protein
MVLAEKVEDTRNELDFHMKCYAEIGKLFQYSTGESLPHLYWRAYFMDNQRKLPLETCELFGQYIGDMNVNVSVLNDLPLLMDSNGTARLNLLPGLAAVAGWGLFGTIWKSFSLPKLLYHPFRLLICILTILFSHSLLERLRKKFIAGNILHRMIHSDHFLDEHLELFTEAQNRLSGRNFCITESGLVGWVSLYAKKGDGICVFRGCRFPFAVRESGPSRSGKYRLRGDIYLHGLMDEDLFERARGDVEDIKLI